MRSAGPASSAEDCCDVSCALAPAIAELGEAEPEGDDVAGQVGIIAALVTPLLVFGMRGSTVEFHAHAELLEEIVEIPVARTLPDPCLPSRGRQSVRTLDPVDVAVLKQGQGPIPGVAECQGDLPAPTHLLAGIHRLTDPIRGGTPASDGPADPLVGVVKGRRDLDKVKHRVLNARARREHGRVPAPQDCI
jgi:hypothetical protein